MIVTYPAISGTVLMIPYPYVESPCTEDLIQLALLLFIISSIESVAGQDSNYYFFSGVFRQKS